MCGSWWYTACGQAAFNAYNYGTADKTSVEGGGIYWKTFTGYSYPLKSDTMQCIEHCLKINTFDL